MIVVSSVRDRLARRRAMRLIERVREANATTSTEDSIALRAAVFVAVMAATLAARSS